VRAGYDAHLGGAIYQAARPESLRSSDPYERADIASNTYYDFFMSDRAALFIAPQTIVARFLDTFKEYPPSQRPSSFSIDQIVEEMQRSLEATAR
jgi:hypothetical protein